MKKVFSYIMLPALIVLAFYSCSKDLGNYDYNDANVITITTDMANVDPAVVINNDSVVVKQNDSLKINILISQTKPSNDLAYEWTDHSECCYYWQSSSICCGKYSAVENKDHLFRQIFISW